jgi:hypothetical protein
MNLIVALYAGVLFFLLSPNVLLRIPKKGSTKMVAFVHAIVFALVLFLTGKLILALVSKMTDFSKKEGLTRKEGLTKKEGITSGPPPSERPPMPSNVEGLGQACSSSNDCNGGEICGPSGTCAAAPVSH